MSSIPNILGFSRAAISPVIFVLILLGIYPLAFWLFIIAGLSDAFDGMIARRLGATTEFGQFLDPFADKILMNLTYIAMGVAGLLPTWLVVMVFARDFILGVNTNIERLKGQIVPPPSIRISKINTGLQIFLAGLVLAINAYHWPIQYVVLPLALATAATTLLSGIGYLRGFGSGR